ncbi:MAG TPA: hypothetical protein VF054_18845 [Micromonosporaceae bacterium]
MQRDAWRSYLGLALGLTEQSRKKATQVAKALVGRGGVTAEQVQTMAEELLRVGSANRDAVVQVVRAELDNALQRVGLVRAEEVEQLNARVRDLELQLRRAEQAAGQPAAAEPGTAAERAAEPAPPTVVKKVAKKAVKKAPATPAATAEAPAAQPAVPAAKKAAKKAVAKKTANKAAPAAEQSTPEAAKKATVVKKATRGRVQP